MPHFPRSVHRFFAGGLPFPRVCIITALNGMSVHSILSRRLAPAPTRPDGRRRIPMKQAILCGKLLNTVKKRVDTDQVIPVEDDRIQAVERRGAIEIPEGS